MACDQQATTGSGTRLKLKTKIFRFEAGGVFPTGFIVGFAGTTNEWMEVADYLYDPANRNPPAMRNSEGLVLTDEGEIFHFSKADKWLLVEVPHFAIGTGSHFALGALESGKSPKEAVRAAMKHDVYTGGGVKTLTIK
jgi:ATP-dependent protease HslVU (ClpYQ) peptidase subunit